MISRLRGLLIHKDSTQIMVECYGVGYTCYISLVTYNSLPEIGCEVIIYIETVMRDGYINLFGFNTQEEQEYYKILVLVDSIGPKLALLIINTLNPLSLSTIIQNHDISKLMSIPGIGKKTAERICFDLNSKIVFLKKIVKNDNGVNYADDAWESNLRSALLNLGFNNSNLNTIINQLSVERPSLTEAVKVCLRILKT